MRVFLIILYLLHLNLSFILNYRRSRRNSEHHEIAFCKRFFNKRYSENYRTISISGATLRSELGRGSNLRSRRKHKSTAWKVVNLPFRFKVPPRSISVLSIGTLVSHTRKPAAGYLPTN